MYYKSGNRLYTAEEIAGKTFHEGNKPEPLFTLPEALEIWYRGLLSDSPGNENADTYFKQTFNITI